MGRAPIEDRQLTLCMYCSRARCRIRYDVPFSVCPASTVSHQYPRSITFLAHGAPRMTTFNFSVLSNNQVIAFDPLTDVLFFDAGNRPAELLINATLNGFDARRPADQPSSRLRLLAGRSAGHNRSGQFMCYINRTFLFVLDMSRLSTPSHRPVVTAISLSGVRRGSTGQVKSASKNPGRIRSSTSTPAARMRPRWRSFLPTPVRGS